jgi:ferredoxin
VQIGALLASPHPLALDTVAVGMVGLPERQVWTQRVAKETGRPGSRLQDVMIIGPDPAGLRPKRFRPAPTTDVGFGLPAPLKRTLRNTITARPVIEANCVRCGDCVRHCPPQAMAIDPRGVQIDYHKCIRCFCCQELCPHSAILTRQGALLKLASLFGRRGR